MLNPWNASFTLAVQVLDKASDAVSAAAETAAETAEAVAADAPDVANAGGGTMQAALLLLQVVLILGLPLFLGVVIAKALKMKEYAGRIGASLLALSIAVAPLAETRLLGRATRGVALDEEQLGAVGVATGAIGELARQSEFAGRRLARKFTCLAPPQPILGALDDLLHQRVGGIRIAG